MRRALGLVLVGMLLLPGGAVGTDASTFAVRMAKVSEEVVEIADFGSSLDDGVLRDSWYRFAFAATADDLRADLLSMEPEPCYLEAYGLAWALWADFRAVADAPDERSLAAAVETMAARDTYALVSDALWASGCGGVPARDPGASPAA